MEQYPYASRDNNDGNDTMAVQMGHREYNGSIIVQMNINTKRAYALHSIKHHIMFCKGHIGFPINTYVVTIKQINDVYGLVL
jgi:hypothetical protein